MGLAMLAVSLTSLKSGLWREIGISFTSGKTSSVGTFMVTCADTKRCNVYRPQCHDFTRHHSASMSSGQHSVRFERPLGEYDPPRRKPYLFSQCQTYLTLD